MAILLNILILRSHHRTIEIAFGKPCLPVKAYGDLLRNPHRYGLGLSVFIVYAIALYTLFSVLFGTQSVIKFICNAYYTI